jgi:hypothetical protein
VSSNPTSQRLLFKQLVKRIQGIEADTAAASIIEAETPDPKHRSLTTPDAKRHRVSRRQEPAAASSNRSGPPAASPGGRAPPGGGAPPGRAKKKLGRFARRYKKSIICDVCLGHQGCFVHHDDIVR